MFEPTGSQRDAASTIFNLSDYRVIDALDVPGTVRRVEIESTSPPVRPDVRTFAHADLRPEAGRRTEPGAPSPAGERDAVVARRR